jgi:hypothetical protein
VALLTTRTGWQPELRFASGWQPELRVASGWQPELRFASGWQPELRFASGWQPELRVASGWQPELRFASGWQPELRVAHRLAACATIYLRLRLRGRTGDARGDHLPSPNPVRRGAGGSLSTGFRSGRLDPPIGRALRLGVDPILPAGCRASRVLTSTTRLLGDGTAGQVSASLAEFARIRNPQRNSKVRGSEAVKKLGQAPSRPLVFQGFGRFWSEPVPFFHSLSALRCRRGVIVHRLPIRRRVMPVRNLSAVSTGRFRQPAPTCRRGDSVRIRLDSSGRFRVAFPPSNDFSGIFTVSSRSQSRFFTASSRPTEHESNRLPVDNTFAACPADRCGNRLCVDFVSVGPQDTAQPARRYPESGVAGRPETVGADEQLLQRYDFVRAVERRVRPRRCRGCSRRTARTNAGQDLCLGRIVVRPGQAAQAKGDSSGALQLYIGAVAHSYLYLFSPQFETTRSYYDPQFRMACDLYNASLEDLLRIINAEANCGLARTYTLECEDHRIDVRVVMRGLWGNRAFERFEFVSDYQVRGLQHRHVNYGLGVPLIAVRRGDDEDDPASSFYPQGMSVPVTAILRAVERPSDNPDQQQVVSFAPWNCRILWRRTSSRSADVSCPWSQTSPRRWATTWTIPDFRNGQRRHGWPAESQPHQSSSRSVHAGGIRSAEDPRADGAWIVV